LGLLPETAETPGTLDNRTKGLFLDTRGYILYLKGEYEPAVNDLTEAIIRVEARILPNSKDANEWTPPMLRGASENESKAQQQRAIAVIHYHRSLAFAALGQEKAAAKDRAMVKVLIGREPDETLF
jgi:hypothetical protein